MKIATVAFCCILLVGIAWPETVAVNAGPRPPELSSSHVQVAVMLDGKPIKDARVDIYNWTVDKGAGTLCFSGSTNENGVVTAPVLAAGDYHAVATLDDVSDFLWLRVIDERTTMMTVLGIDLTGSVQQARQIQDDAVKRAEGLPTLRVQLFQGAVVDQAGAVIRGAKVRIMKNGPEGRTFVFGRNVDSVGHFSARLPDGIYIGIVYSEGFRAEAVPFEVTNKGSGDLRVVLQVGPMQLPILVATPSGAQ